MVAATLPMMINVLVAAMFVASFLTIAQLTGFSHIRWFALSYAIAIATPLADVLAPLVPLPNVLLAISFAGVFVGMVLVGPSLSFLYGRKPAWGVTAALIAGGLILRALIWDGPRDALWYQFAYQFPYFVAALFCAGTIRAHGHGSSLDRATIAVFLLSGFHFLLKPVAAQIYGMGDSAASYADTTYAIVSQTASGAMLVAAGLLILINALHIANLRDRHEATSDALTGLPNRRALKQAFQRIQGDRNETTEAGAIAIVDLDHFKRVNDEWGHERGDRVLRAVGQCLRANGPVGSTVFRIGGEEFVILMPDWQERVIQRACSALCQAVSRLDVAPVDHITISVGATAIGLGEELSSALVRADRGLYRAKSAGRDCWEIEPLEATVPRRRTAAI